MSGPASPSLRNHVGPRALRSAEVMLSSHIFATTARSVPLAGSLPLPSCPPVIGRVFAYRPPARGSLLWVGVPSTRAATRTPRGDLGAFARSFPRSKAFPSNGTGRLLCLPDTDFSRSRLTTLQCSLHAAARVVARPPVPVRPEATLRPPRALTSELSRGQVAPVASRI